MMILAVCQGMAHELFAALELATVIKHLGLAFHQATQRQVIELEIQVEFRSHRAAAQFRGSQVKVVDGLGGVVRPFVTQCETKAARDAVRVDDITADQFGLFTTISSKGRNVECFMMAAQDPPVSLVEPFRCSTAVPGFRLPAGQSHGNHASRVGFRFVL